MLLRNWSVPEPPTRDEDVDIPELATPAPDPVPAPAPTHDNLPSLSRELPHTFQREEPLPPPPPPPSSLPLPPSHHPSPEPVAAPAVKYVNTKPDEFGIYCSYPELLSSIPDEEVPIADVCEGAGFPVPLPSNPLSIFGSAVKQLNKNIVAPFLNITVFQLMRWFYNGSQTKSITDLDTLVQEVLLPDDFSQDHLWGFSTQKVLKDMDDYGGPSYVLQAEDEEHERIQKQDWEQHQRDPEYVESDIPNTIAGIMTWSDTTKVGQWEDESMWPIYLYFGNQSKYKCAKPSSFVAHHLAYIPKLPDHFNDFYKKHYRKAPTEAVLTHI
ncbi:hypothetical protein VKT23_017706 [Stygiomarasmius scandens]|uniref:Uncharacterized protein n=1 Tax=Marasmiellus scandens TaxID=2682957 RepID=A0ABR1IUF9_9AGAR